MVKNVLILILFCLLGYMAFREKSKFEASVYSIVCVDNVKYIIFDSGATTVKKDTANQPELCDLDEN